MGLQLRKSLVTLYSNVYMTKSPGHRDVTGKLLEGDVCGGWLHAANVLVCRVK